jgi:hypothetical protein
MLKIESLFLKEVYALKEQGCDVSHWWGDFRMIDVRDNTFNLYVEKDGERIHHYVWDRKTIQHAFFRPIIVKDLICSEK